MKDNIKIYQDNVGKNYRPMLVGLFILWCHIIIQTIKSLIKNLLKLLLKK